MPSPDLLDALALLNSRRSLESLIPAVLDITLQLTGADRSLLMISSESGELSLQAGRNRSNEDLSEEAFLGSRSILRKVSEERVPLYIPDMSRSKEFGATESVRELQLQSAICLPLQTYGESKLAGILYMDSRSVRNRLKEEHLQIMQALVNHMAVAIENARLFQELEKKNEELEETNRRLDQQNKQIELLNRQLQQRVEFQSGNLAELEILLAQSQRELSRVYGVGNLIGKSKPMLNVFRILDRVVRTNATVLILGESGTGKEVVAKYIHYNGPRSEKAMVSINCSAFNETLLESELFGHRKGTFTGATENKTGLFQVADGGTLFLDELGDMSLEMQKKLLRVLQEGEVRPIGSPEVYEVDVRIIAATNQDLKKLMEEGKFREDLFYRINVITIHLPPLRDRLEDVPLLIDFFSKKISHELGIESQNIPDNILQQFLEYDWPGNVRELENELRRVFILQSDYGLSRSSASASEEPEKKKSSLNLDSMEKNAILKALQTAGGNKTKAAELLGIPRRTFYRKLSEYGLD